MTTFDGLTGCDWFASVSAEFALGSLTGPERSAAIAHAETCAECMACVKSLSQAADDLLLVAPEIDPPAGFEVRLLERRHRQLAGNVGQSLSSGEGQVLPMAGGRRRSSGRAPGTARSRRFSRIAAAAAAALVLAAGGAGIGAAAASHRSPAIAAGPLRIATLHGAGAKTAANLGEVVIADGTPGWVLMTVDDAAWSGWLNCVVTEHGRSTAVGSFLVRNGYGSWAVKLSSAGSDITSARVVAGGGNTLAIAKFH